MTRLTAILVAAFLWALPWEGFGGAAAQQLTASPCVGAETLKDGLTVVFPASPIVDLRGLDARIYVDTYNAAPPISDIEADRVLITLLPKGALVAFVKNGTVCKRVHISLSASAALLETVLDSRRNAS